MSTGISYVDEFVAEVQDVCNQLYELYDETNEICPPHIYGAILGLHERLEIALKQIDINGKVVSDPKDFPEDLRIRQYPEQLKAGGKT
jgi:hypothetical protein